MAVDAIVYYGMSTITNPLICGIAFEGLSKIEINIFRKLEKCDQR